MEQLNTKYPLLINNKYGYVDPSIITYFVDIKKKGLTRINLMKAYTKINPYIYFIIELASLILNENNIKHFKNEWDIDIIQYNLSGEINVDSTLALHKEDDNGHNMVSVLFYLRKDNTLTDGNLIYIDKDKNKQTIIINNETTLIMDGRVYHQPELCSGCGYRQTIIVGFIRDY